MNKKYLIVWAALVFSVIFLAAQDIHRAAGQGDLVKIKELLKLQIEITSENRTLSKLVISCHKSKDLKSKHNCMYLVPISGSQRFDLCQRYHKFNRRRPLWEFQ